MKEFTRVMKALSDPNRVKILKLLENGPLCVCQVHGALGLAQPTVSRHLRILEDAGLITGRKDRMWVHYGLSPERASSYARLLLEYMPDWLNEDPEVAGARALVAAGCKTLEIQPATADA